VSEVDDEEEQEEEVEDEEPAASRSHLSGSHGESPPSRHGLAPRAGGKLRRGLVVAGGAYAVVAVFAGAYGLLTLAWPTLSSTKTVAVASLLAAPLALALLWPRLTGFKAFGFEVSLSQSSVRVQAELVGAITAQQYYSGQEDLIDRWANAIRQPGTELVEVNLREGDYWWSTRLYLLATLMEDYTDVKQIAFVENSEERFFLGFATSSDVRRALATAFPEMELRYAEIHSDSNIPPARASLERVRYLVNAWVASSFGPEGKKEDEETFKELVTDVLLKEWLGRAGKSLAQDSIDWSGITDADVVHSIIVEFDWPYVALLRHRRLHRVVNRLDLALRVAVSATG
jgi:hypothetical protein